MRTIKVKNNNNIAENKSYEAMPLEKQIAQMLVTGQPVEGGSPNIFTERKDGVKPEYDIRTDRFDVAMEAVDKASAMGAAMRTELFKQDTKKEPKTAEPSQQTAAE